MNSAFFIISVQWLKKHCKYSFLLPSYNKNTRPRLKEALNKINFKQARLRLVLLLYKIPKSFNHIPYNEIVQLQR